MKSYIITATIFVAGCYTANNEQGFNTPPEEQSTSSSDAGNKLLPLPNFDASYDGEFYPAPTELPDASSQQNNIIIVEAGTTPYMDSCDAFGQCLWYNGQEYFCVNQPGYDGGFCSHLCLNSNVPCEQPSTGCDTNNEITIVGLNNVFSDFCAKYKEVLP